MTWGCFAFNAQCVSVLVNNGQIIQDIKECFSCTYFFATNASPENWAPQKAHYITHLADNIIHFFSVNEAGFLPCWSQLLDFNSREICVPYWPTTYTGAYIIVTHCRN